MEMAASQMICSLLWGKVPGRKELCLYYLELTDRHLHIFEGNEDPNSTRKHLRSLEVNASDYISKDASRKQFKFTYDRGSDGKYSFICSTEEERERWMNSLQKLIHKRDLQEKGYLPDKRATLTSSLPAPVAIDPPMPPPHRSHTLHNQHKTGEGTPPPPPPHKRDSGFVSSGWEVTHSSYPTQSSDDGVIAHRKSDNFGKTASVALTSGTSHSADGKLVHTTNRTAQEEEEDLKRYEWYWGPMKRGECEEELKARGTVGNFVVRKNDSGFYIMSFWRKDTIHHHKILKRGKMYYFEKSAVEAEGEGIPDLLDIYMKHCSDKTIGPFGGELHPSYDEAWNPPDIDFDKFQKKLSDIKDATGKKRMFAAGASADQHTYGGLTLNQMKEVIQVDSEQGPPQMLMGGVQLPVKPSDLKPAGKSKPPPPSPKKSPKPLPNKPAPATVNRSPSLSNKDLPAVRQKRSPGTPPTPNSPRQNQPNSYANLMIPPSQAQPRPHPHAKNGYKPSTGQQNIDEEDEFDDDEEQEVYVEPGKLGSEQQCESNGIYQNHNFNPPVNSAYANVNYDDSSVYQNVTHHGAPVTPPRIKPKVKPKK